MSWQMILMAKLVWTFDFAPGEGEIDDSVETGYFGGFLMCPKQFPLKITPRSDAHAKVVEKEFEGVKPFLEKFGD